MSAEDLHYWASELGCSEWKLLDAIAFVGVLAEDVRRYVGTHPDESGAH